MSAFASTATYARSGRTPGEIHTRGLRSRRRQRHLIATRPRFRVKHAHSLLIQRLGLGVRVGHRGQAERSILTDAVDHVQDDAGLPRLVEVQAVPRHDIEQIVMREYAIVR